MKKYMCLICGFIYDEAEGRPEEGIPPGTKGADIPLSWRCPECGSGKDIEVRAAIRCGGEWNVRTRARSVPGSAPPAGA